MEGEELRLLVAEDPSKATKDATTTTTTTGDEKSCAEIVDRLLEGKYEQVVLESDASKNVVQALKDNDAQFDDRTIEVVRDRIASYVNEDPAQKERREFEAFSAGLGYFFAFVQANWTGPNLPSTLVELSSQFLEGENNTQKKKNALQYFVANEEPFYAKTIHPFFLYVAKAILIESYHLLTSIKYKSLWAARLLFVQQQMLENPAEQLQTSIVQHMDEAVSLLGAPEAKALNRSERLLAARVHLEYGLVHHYYRYVKKSQECFLQSQKMSGLDMKLTGVMGKRRKYQESSVANLALHAKSVKSDETTATTTAESSVPKEVALDDEETLAKPALETTTEDGEEVDLKSNLEVIDQAIILALCLNVKNQNPTHGLTTEEMFPYVQRVQENPNNWMVHSTCLFIKSRLESEKYRTAERAVLQLQALADQFNDSEESQVKDRMRYISCVAFPPRHLLKRELGSRFIALGVAASALQIFEELDMWDEIVQCYAVMEKEKKAEAIVRERLALGETPELWTILGDLTKDEECYRKSWKMSNQRYSRAARSLARYLLAVNRCKESIEFFEAALAINPLYATAWFSMGCAAMRIEDWNKAIKAFGRAVHLEPEDGQAWNNLASVYIRLKQKKEAWNALQEGLKYEYDNWKMWLNFLYVSMDLHQMHHAVQAFYRLIDLNQEVDTEILGMLTSYAIDDYKLSRKDSILMHQVQDLFKTITAKTSSVSPLWSLYGKLLLTVGDEEQGLECYFKRARTVQVAGWERDKTLFADVATGALELVEACVAHCKDPKKFYSVRLFVRGLVKKSESNFGGTEPHKQLEHALNILTTTEQKLQASSSSS